jgi:hypothetical protein
MSVLDCIAHLLECAYSISLALFALSPSTFVDSSAVGVTFTQIFAISWSISKVVSFCIPRDILRDPIATVVRSLEIIGLIVVVVYVVCTDNISSLGEGWRVPMAAIGLAELVWLMIKSIKASRRSELLVINTPKPISTPVMATVV